MSHPEMDILLGSIGDIKTLISSNRVLLSCYTISIDSLSNSMGYIEMVFRLFILVALECPQRFRHLS